jgi:hypothetical protein
MTPRWNLASHQQQGQKTTAWGQDYYKATKNLMLHADERVFAQAVLAYKKTTGKRLFDNVYHWGDTGFIRAKIRSYLRVGLLEKGLSIDTCPESMNDSKDSFACVCWSSGDEALIA